MRNSLANLTNQIQFSVEYRKLFFWIVSRNFKCGKKGCCAHFRHKAKIEFNFDDYLRHIAIGDSTCGLHYRSTTAKCRRKYRRESRCPIMLQAIRSIIINKLLRFIWWCWFWVYKKDDVLRVVSLTYLFLLQIYLLLSVLQLDNFMVLLHYLILCVVQ